MPNSAFAAADQDCAACYVEVGLSEIERFADSQSSPPQDYDQRPQSSTIAAAAGGAHHRDDLLHGRVGQRDSAGLCSLARDLRESQAS
jgi:hypothetical protein